MGFMESIRDERLAQYGAEAANSIRVTGKISGRRAAAWLRRAQRALTEISQDPDAPEWYADNEYLARRETNAARNALQNTASLLRGKDGPALLMLCRALVRAGPVTEERIADFLTGARRAREIPEQEAALFGAVLRWALVEALTPAAEDRQAAELFTSLRVLSELDLTEALERSDPVDAVLRGDGTYPLMDEATRAMYRARCGVLAKKHNTSPLEEARAALEKNIHSALFPFEEKRGELYIAANVVITAFLALLFGFLTQSALTAALLAVPISEFVHMVLDSALLRVVRPRILPRLSLENGAGPAGRTVCAVSALLSDKEVGPRLARRLEEFRLASRDCGEDLLFALLADMPESKTFPCPGGAECLRAAADAVEGLNAKYGGGFFLLTRDAVWCNSDKVWMPWERKRGAILELARLLQGSGSSLRVAAGDEKQLRARYILTLDADTRLVPGAARALIGAAAHPLNRPVVKDGVVVRGHAVIHPRMATDLPRALQTDFAKITAGQGGTDSYGSPTGELFSDLFGRGGFAGKGILDAAAYLACLDGRIPDNLVLSHDAVEGAYLRGAYMGDVLLTDSAPLTAAGWFRRLHRWTRGDWQNISWLFGRGRDLTPIDRWRLFDSLRRSLVGPFSFAAVALGFCLPFYLPCALAALFCLAAEAVHDAWAGLFVRTADARQRCRSGVLRGLGGSLTRLMARLILLPWEAWCRLSACLVSLWRMGFSKRHLLRWVTAAQSDGHKGAPEFAWFAVAAGAGLIVFAPSILGKAAGVVWVLSPLFVRLTGLPHKPKNDLTDADRTLLEKSAAAIWLYFSEQCVPEDGYLPPDNFQVQPPKGAARRTSPTNIGLALISALAAVDLGVAAQKEAFALIENILTTLETLPKWRGHLYNWYATHAGTPLSPAYVSTVDSGNLCVCLLCLKNGLLEYGRADLAGRAEELANTMDFTPLYDRKKRLFRIGLDPVTGEPSPGHYDLLASEARLTSFLCVAKGYAPPRHWSALSRAQLSLDGWRGLASWSGSIFEYLMPELFLPLVPGSLLWETARFCLYAQRRRGRRVNAPWGNSESAFFSLDAGMDYRYKAHGTGALALKRDVDAELVVSPYSSFLALAVHPKAAVKNLRRLKTLGLWGQYGFYEAIDFTPGRSQAVPKAGSGRKFVLAGSVVECYMSHHIGMSMAAVANSLLPGVMRRRFMAEIACAAYEPLLAERVPLGGPVLRRSQSPAGHTAPPRPEGPVLALESSSPDAAEGAWFPLSNGVYSIRACENGLCRATAGEILMYRPGGFELSSGDVPLTPSPRLGVVRPWRYEGGVLTFTTRLDDSIMSTSVTAAARQCGEARRVAAAGKSLLQIRFEPVLARRADYEAHPAFWRLGLEVRIQEGLVTVRRLQRGTLPECWLCLAATAPLRIVRGAGWQMTGPVLLEAPLPESGFLTLGLCFGQTRAQAVSGARAILTGGSADMASSMAMLLGLGPEELKAAFGLCTSLCAPRVESAAFATRQALWKHGLSGDMPVVWCEAVTGTEEAKRLVKRHALLTACGVASDLVVDTGEGGDYLRPRAAELRKFLDRYGLSPFENAQGGVHFASGPEIRSCAVLPPRGHNLGTACFPVAPVPERSQAVPQFRWLTGGAFAFDTPPLPPRAWADILTNGHFGYLATDAGTGNMWLENAHEFPVSPWDNDPLSVRGRERLDLLTPGGRHSLFADGDGGCRVTYGFGWARWERAGCAVTAFVPRKYKARILLIEGGDGAHIGWHTALSLCADRADAPFVITGYEGGCLTAVNPRASLADGVFRAAASKPFSSFTCDETAWLRGEMNGRTGSGLRPCMAAQWEGGGTTVLACGFEDSSVLRALAEPQRAAQELMQVRDGWRDMLSRVRVKTPDPDLDNLLNGWAVYQTAACRLLGRTSLYQNGGAYGFRDQVQDAVNLIAVSPGIARRHILLCCARQFGEGDVLHWWHEGPEGPRGVRTRCSDDLLWLAWALCEYTEKTGDTGLCGVNAPWLTAEPLGDKEPDRYFLPAASDRTDTVLEHARRALALVLRRGEGAHGLLLMGGGDWNDGMDKVGGESVWLTWFFAHTAGRFAKLLRALGEPDALLWEKAAADSAAAANEAWDGAWYLRGYWSDGAPLGNTGAAECAIDSVAQSWAAFCPGADRTRVRRALHECYVNLYDEAHGLTKLFWPPFSDGERDPGYIRACGPGFRENGGQYTHGAVWLASAMLKEGMTEEGTKILLSVLPARHSPAQWETEPFVLAADVSANADHYAAALWSWYTGSAGWFFRTALEDLLGIRLEGGNLTVKPNLPAGWSGYEADVAGHHIRVCGDSVTIT